MSRESVVGLALAALVALAMIALGLWLRAGPSESHPVAEDGEAERARTPRSPGDGSRPPEKLKPLASGGRELAPPPERPEDWKPGMRKPEPAELPVVQDTGAMREGEAFASNAAGIRASIEQVMPGLQECYEAWLDVEPDLQGDIKVSYQIYADGDAGRVRRVTTTEQDVDNAVFEGCVLNVMNELEYVAPSGGPITVNWPLKFRSDP